jgi:hypothetical protein
LIFLHSNHYPRCRALVDKYFEDYASLQWIESGAVELLYDVERYVLISGEATTWFWPAFPARASAFTRRVGRTNGTIATPRLPREI